MKKGTWHQDINHAKRAGKLGAAKSPWRKPCPPEVAKKNEAERISRLRSMGIVA